MELAGRFCSHSLYVNIPNKKRQELVGEFTDMEMVKCLQHKFKPVELVELKKATYQ